MGDQHQQTLLEEYEEAYFRLLMDRMAEAEGTDLLARSEALRADPAAAIPEELHKKFLRLISHAFAARRKKEEADQAQAAKEEKRAKRERRVNFTWSLASKIAVSIILLAAIVSVAFASAPELRAMVINTVMDVHDTYTDFSFVSSEREAPAELVITPGWIPNGFDLAGEDFISTCAYQSYESGSGESILLEKFLPNTISMDTEDAVVTAVETQGYSGTLIQKGEENQLIWLNTDENIVYIVGTTGLADEITFKIAENFD
jgi:hypothetical protein